MADQCNYVCTKVFKIMFDGEVPMINLYSHGGSGNHGCEAIVRSTVGMLGNNINLYSQAPEQDFYYGLNKICNIKSDLDFSVKKGTVSWLSGKMATKITGNIDLEIRYKRKQLFSHVHKSDMYLSIGGDNYCYDGTEILSALNRNLKRRKAKTILWGCSVTPELLTRPGIAEDLALYDLIVARESISYNALAKVNTNTILASDPAFTLERVDLPLPEKWEENNMVGINASPLILRSAKEENIAFEAYCRLITEILENTNYSIVLIPHVVWKENDDRIPLKNLYTKYADSNRIIMLDDHNCMETKGYIARCRMFIGARTHATIAAYSSNVPTLVLGYSVKARGIAKDLFGTDSQYVIPVQEMTDANALVDGFRWLSANEKRIRNYLEEKTPAYIKKAYNAKKGLLEI